MPRPVRLALLRPMAVLLSVAIGMPAAATAHAADELTSQEVRRRMETAAERLHHAEEDEAELRDEIDTLQRRIDEAERERVTVNAHITAYAREAYKSGRGIDPMVTLITAGKSDNAMDKIEMLDQAGRTARETMQRANVLHRELRVSRAALAERRQKLAAAQERLAADGAELQALFTVVSKREAATEARLAAEAARLRRVRLAEERKKLERKRAARLRASRAKRLQAEAAADEDDSDSPEADESEGNDDESDSGAVSGSGLACAVGPAHTFRNTWGDRRSGGRRHKGTDIFAPHGSPIYAVTSGVIAGIRSGGLGGKSIILRGDNGDSYYYAHNSSHSVSSGERVRAGEHIGSVGATGNAAGGAAHVHFERWPGGGRPRNPYSFLRQVCG